MDIIPAIDIIDGKCVRLTQGNYAEKKIYNEAPLEIAKQFEGAGIQRLHLVDLDGAMAGAVTNWKVLETIAAQTNLAIDFGGGIQCKKDLEKVFQSGATWATIGTLAVKRKTEFLHWIEEYGTDKFLLGADVKDQMIAVHGWTDQTDIGVFDFIRQYMQQGVKQIFCTDISKDGKLEGPSLSLYKDIVTTFPLLHFIASGGVASVSDLTELEKIGCQGAIVGKAIYENNISLKDIMLFNKNQQC